MAKYPLPKSHTKSTSTKLILKPKSKKLPNYGVSIDFKPGPKHELYKRCKGKSILPVFNKDKRFYTPTFVLRNVQIETIQQHRKSHEQKIQEYTTEIDVDQIELPKPKSRNKYCGVCKDHYEDYLEHIKSEDHQNLHMNARYTRLINILCESVNGKKTVRGWDETDDWKECYKRLKSDEQPWGTLVHCNNSTESGSNNNDGGKKLTVKGRNGLKGGNNYRGSKKLGHRHNPVVLDD